jgi:hypothetical protein
MNEIFGPAVCAKCRTALYTTFCRGCCLVYCEACKPRDAHGCARRDEPAAIGTSPVAQPIAKGERRRDKRKP